MVTREALYRLIDDLPDDALLEAERSLKALGEPDADTFLRTLRDAPLDDEEETDEERALVAEARAAVARGDVVSDRDLERELGW